MSILSTLPLDTRIGIDGPYRSDDPDKRLFIKVATTIETREQLDAVIKVLQVYQELLGP